MSRPTREQIIEAFPLVQQMLRDGVVLVGSGVERNAVCCFHEDKNPSMRVNVVKQTWFCNAGCGGGSIIDYLSRKRGVNPEDVLRELSEELEKRGEPLPSFRSTPTTDKPTTTYTYRNATGEPVFRVLRYEPKTFRQQRKTPDGWTWGMEGVERVLYHLPEILASGDGYVVVLEGERDVETLRALALTATCNVGGAGKWLDGYTACLKGKDVVLCGDNDEPGRAHIKRIIEALDGSVKRLRHVIVPDPAKDITDYLGAATSQDAAAEMWSVLLEKAAVLGAGSTVPILSMVEAEQRYQQFIKDIEGESYSFAGWLPTFGRRIRPCVPGDVISFVAATKAGKTACLQNMFFNAAPLPCLLFEMELADSLTFERFVAGVTRMSGDEVEQAYKERRVPAWRETGKLDNVFICPKSSLTVPEIEQIVMRSELKIGRRPLLVGIDYMQLLNGQGRSRYEKMTDVAAAVKAMAKNTRTIVVVASQVSRKPGDESKEIGAYDAKDSGQIENSSSLMIGVWKDEEDGDTITMRVNLNTKGRPGLRIKCNFDGARCLITEQVARKIDDADVPPPLDNRSQQS